MKEKFGIVALLDALGARSSTTKESKEYLQEITRIRSKIGEYLDITLSDLTSESKKAYKELRPRFFGDSILFTYRVPDEDQLDQYIDRIAFILSILIPEAMAEGILFRGAISIGEYVETRDIVLGPAVVDAANWYEKMEMVGVMLTPRASNYLKSALHKKKMIDFYKDQHEFIHEYNIPNKVRPGMTGYVVKWPPTIEHLLEPEIKDPMHWYYDVIKNLRIPLGVEDKYLNTEAYVRFAIGAAQQESRTGP